MIKKFIEFLESSRSDEMLDMENIKDQFLRLKEIFDCDIEVGNDSGKNYDLFGTPYIEPANSYSIYIRKKDNSATNRGADCISDELETIKHRLVNYLPVNVVIEIDPKDCNVRFDYKMNISKKYIKKTDRRYKL